MNQSSPIRASLIVPIYNEERFIAECVHSLQQQDLPARELEILLVDGCSTDGTMEILQQLAAENPQQIRVLTNPKRIQSAAMNLGAAHARGTYLVRIDAHAEYPANYVSTCIRLLEEMGADNAGCSTVTKARTWQGSVIAMLLTSSFGVGGSAFRVGAEDGFVDTVPFGTFRKDYFLRIGGFDERLARSEDNEINYRIRKLGGRIYMTNRVQTTYYCRETVGALGKMAYGNGKWTILAGKLCPGSMSLKYFIPLVFTLSLLIMPVLSLLWWGFAALFALELLLYFALALLSSLQKTRNLKELLFLLALFPIFHVCYGVGSIGGILALITNKL